MISLDCKPEIIGPAIHRLGGLTLSELHNHTGLPGCFIEELLFNDLRPDTSWAADFPKVQLAKQYLRVFEILPKDLPKHWQAIPYVCLHTTIQFLDREAHQVGNCVTLLNHELTPRTEPNLSFVEYNGELWEVTGGRVEWDDYLNRWIWWHHAMRNTERARHFRGVHGHADCGGDWCVPCRQIDFIREYGHGNYAKCEYCARVLCLVPDHVKGPVLPRHRLADGSMCFGGDWWPAAGHILEPAEAKPLLSPEGSL